MKQRDEINWLVSKYSESVDYLIFNEMMLF